MQAQQDSEAKKNRALIILGSIGISTLSAAVGYWWITDMSYRHRENAPMALVTIGVCALLAAWAVRTVLDLKK